MTNTTWVYDGLSVTPIENGRRNIAGGTAIDICIHDARSTVTRATVNADRLVAVAYHQNGRAVTFPEVTTEDLIISAIRCKDITHRDLARTELTRRGVDWSAYLGCR